MSRQGNKTVVRTFRVDEAALEIVEKDAQEKRISANTLVNHLLLAYANYDRYLEHFPMLKISSPIFGCLLDGVSDDYAKEAGKRLAQNLARAVIISRRGGLSMSTLIDHFRDVSNYGKGFTLKEAEANGKTLVTLYHRYGRKGSLYFREYLAASFELIDKQPKLTTTENSVTASF